MNFARLFCNSGVDQAEFYIVHLQTSFICYGLHLLGNVLLWSATREGDI